MHWLKRRGDSVRVGLEKGIDEGKYRNGEKIKMLRL
jgi:hypothetical protein